MKRPQVILWLCFVFLAVSSIIGIYSLIRSDVGIRAKHLLATNNSQDLQGLYQVIAVSDGDTIEVDMNGKTERVRFIGVDTPETHHPDRPVECFGLEAASNLESRLNGKWVRLEADPLSSNRDRYDRLLRYVFLGDDLLNQSIISEGYGFAYTPFEFSKLEKFLAAEQRAKYISAGLWGTCDTKTSNGTHQTLYRQ